jgi:3-oxoadipate enol-lactonase
MPGYGASASLPTVTIAGLAKGLQDFLPECGAARPCIVGHSIGGMIVQQLLAGGPDAARAVVLAQTSPAFGRPDGDWQHQFVGARLGPLDRGETMASLAHSLVDELTGDDPDPRGVALARQCMAAVPDATYRTMMRALIGFDLRAALGRIKIPTLVLSGSRDNNAPAPMMAKMAAHIRSASYVELERVGHLANLENPGAFNSALANFLGAHSSVARAAR